MPDCSVETSNRRMKCKGQKRYFPRNTTYSRSIIVTDNEHLHNTSINTYYVTINLNNYTKYWVYRNEKCQICLYNNGWYKSYKHNQQLRAEPSSVAQNRSFPPLPAPSSTFTQLDQYLPCTENINKKNTFTWWKRLCHWWFTVRILTEKWDKQSQEGADKFKPANNPTHGQLECAQPVIPRALR